MLWYFVQHCFGLTTMLPEMISAHIELGEGRASGFPRELTCLSIAGCLCFICCIVMHGSTVESCSRNLGDM